jgi:hypothetical protein
MQVNDRAEHESAPWNSEAIPRPICIEHFICRLYRINAIVDEH